MVHRKCHTGTPTEIWFTEQI